MPKGKHLAWMIAIAVVVVVAAEKYKAKAA